MAILLSILSIEPKQRSHNQVKRTQKGLADNPFFAEIAKSRDEKTQYELCDKLRLEEHSADAVIFNFGDPGSYFYVIIEGSVDVRVPNQV
jgi:CRP-like cAMP-binding protein